MSESNTIDEVTSAPAREWGYPEAIVLMGGLTLGFMTLQSARPAQLGILGAPAAFSLVFILLTLPFLTGALLPTHSLVRFLAGIPFTITSLVFLSAGALAGTLILQNPSPEDAAKLGSALRPLQRLAVGMAQVDTHTWFFKMTGDGKAVLQARPVFLQLLRSLRPTSRSSEVAST